MFTPLFYVYKCINDSGGAPCIDGRLWSLCICKPNIRSTALEGDIVFAFGSNHEQPANRLIYIAKVTLKLTDGAYYERAEYRDRSDCIYKRDVNGRFRIRRDAKHHVTMEAMDHDLGEPPRYPRANSLVSSDFRYFGKDGTDAWNAKAPALRRLVESLGQGHRVNHNRTIRDELLLLQRWIWSTYKRKVLGRPLHAPKFDPCSGESKSTKKGCRRTSTC